MNMMIRGIAICLLTIAVGAWGHEGPHKAEPRLMLTQSQALQKAFSGLTIERKPPTWTRLSLNERQSSRDVGMNPRL